MKKLITIGCIVLLGVTGCDSGPYNGARNRQAVVDKYSVDVWNLPQEKFKFMARKPDGSVWYVETLGTGDNLISDETIVFGPTE